LSRLLLVTIAIEAKQLTSLRTAALYAKVIPINQALAMPGGFGALMGATDPLLGEQRAMMPYPLDLCSRLFSKVPDLDTLGELEAVGRYLIGHPATPWARTVRYNLAMPALDA
jgi:hypothetical protein